MFTKVSKGKIQISFNELSQINFFVMIYREYFISGVLCILIVVFFNSVFPNFRVLCFFSSLVE